MKRLLAMTVATVIATSGCGYLNAWRCGYTGNSGCCDTYDAGYDDAIYDDGAIYDGGEYLGEGEYPVYGDGAIVGPEMIIPGETIAAPTGEPLPEPAQ